MKFWNFIFGPEIKKSYFYSAKPPARAQVHMDWAGAGMSQGTQAWSEKFENYAIPIFILLVFLCQLR